MMISYEQFLSAIQNDLHIRTNFDLDNGRSRYSSAPKKAPRDIIGETWVTGGECGGSCWDDGEKDNHSPVTPEREAELEDLQRILEHFVPNMSFMVFKRLEREIVKIEESGFGESEYYGNYTTGAAKYVILEDLYKFLEKDGLLPLELPPKPEDKDEND